MRSYRRPCGAARHGRVPSYFSGRFSDALRRIGSGRRAPFPLLSTLQHLPGGWTQSLLAVDARRCLRDWSSCDFPMTIPLSDPDITAQEVAAVSQVMGATQLSDGPAVHAFEAAFAQYLGRQYAVAVASGTLGMLLALKAYGIGLGQEVIASAYSWRETAHAIPMAGATPVFCDIDYYSSTIAVAKAEARIGEDAGSHRRQHQWTSCRVDGTAGSGRAARVGSDRGFDRGDGSIYKGALAGELWRLRSIRFFAARPFDLRRGWDGGDGRWRSSR